MTERNSTALRTTFALLAIFSAAVFWGGNAIASKILYRPEAGFDAPALGRKIIQSFLRHALRDGLFHADMHQGNLFIDPGGRIVAVDTLGTSVHITGPAEWKERIAHSMEVGGVAILGQ